MSISRISIRLVIRKHLRLHLGTNVNLGLYRRAMIDSLSDCQREPHTKLGLFNNIDFGLRLS
jgi:hypothetical protein